MLTSKKDVFPVSDRTEKRGSTLLIKLKIRGSLGFGSRPQLRARGAKETPTASEEFNIHISRLFLIL